MENLTQFTQGEQSFIEQLDSETKPFVEQFLKQGVCFRCILLLFRVTNLQVYRQDDYKQLALHFNHEYNDEKLCKICQGVLQYCHKEIIIQQVCTSVKEQEFEFEDFKITFSISIIAYLNKIYFIQKAQETLSKKFKYNIENNKNALDFKEVFKWIVSPILSKALNVPANLDGNFLINFNFAKRESQSEDPISENVLCQKLNDYLQNVGISLINQSKRKQKWNNKQQDKSQRNQLGAEQLLNKFTMLPLPLIVDLPIYKQQDITELNLTEIMNIECSSENLLLYGRYTKLSREVSQTPWLLDKNRKLQNVQEEISKNILEIFGATDAYLHAAGREDIDVRMLGRGRPFVMEFVNPRKSVSCRDKISQLQECIKSDVIFCIDFRLVSKKYFDELKEIENSKAKSYCCLVWTQRRITKQDCQKIEDMQNLQLKQKTPIRVLHRRSLMVRDKLIYKMKAEYINQHYFVLHMIASAGTYIKEFVHGDLGRTVPSIGLILECDADILQLDVTQVYDSIESVDLTDPKLFDIEINDPSNFNQEQQKNQ